MSGMEGVGGVPSPGLAGMAPRDAHAALRKASKEFEGIFLAQLFRTMRESVPDSGLTERGSGEEMFTSMLDDRIADLDEVHKVVAEYKAEYGAPEPGGMKKK